MRFDHEICQRGLIGNSLPGWDSLSGARTTRTGHSVVMLYEVAAS